MSLEDAVYAAALIDAARDEVVEQGEAALEEFHATVRGLFAGEPTRTELRSLLSGPAGVLLAALALSWLEAVNTLNKQVHARLNLPDPLRLTSADARDLMRPGVLALQRAALLGTLTDGATSLSLVKNWDRQYEKGGAFTAVRGTLRGVTAGTLTTLANASVIDSARANAPNLILGAYNPLDERTADLDRALVLNPGVPITTARGRVVTAIPGRQGKYTLENAWVPGPPSQGGDTHEGCRCWLTPESA
jgi:hypothetical protein